MVAVVEGLKLAALNGLGACGAVNVDAAVPADVKLKVAFGAAVVGVEVAGALPSIVVGFVLFSPLKRLAPLAGVAVLGANKLVDGPLVVVVPPKMILD